MLAAAVLIVFIPSNDVVVLKESARVSGRFVRLADLVETGTAAEIYLGRSPEEGRTRVVTVEEIRRELERRGMEPEAVTFVGKRIEVTRGEEPPTQELRRALALEIKRRLLEKNPDDRAEEIVVRIVSLRPENVPPQCRIVDVRERGVLEFSLGLVDSEKNAIDAEVVARVVRLREAAFAAREIPPGKHLERGDLELRRVEQDEDDPASGAIAALLGATTAVRISAGARIAPAHLTVKAAVRKGDVVRAISSAYEVDARALEDGSAGQEILLEFVASKNRFRARVAGSARVEVVEEGR